MVGNAQGGRHEPSHGLQFCNDGGRHVKATLDSPDQNAMGIPLGRVTLTDDSLFVEAPMIRGRYAGKVSGDSLITGTWTQLGKKLYD